MIGNVHRTGWLPGDIGMGPNILQGPSIDRELNPRYKGMYLGPYNQPVQCQRCCHVLVSFDDNQNEEVTRPRSPYQNSS
jgi:hypothetical protein